MQFGQRLDQRQPEAGAPGAAGVTVVQLLERLHHPLDLIVGDADPGVADRDRDRLAGCQPRLHGEDTAARRFANEEDAFVYSRFSNPTVTMMERRLAALEGTTGCIGTSSGMAAITLLILGLLKAGDHVVCSQSVFGSTIKLFQDFAKFGVETSFVSQTDVSAWKAAMRPTTKLLFAESPTNPLTEVCDIAALAEIARAGAALLAVDNCFCSPALQQPVKLGADIVVRLLPTASELLPYLKDGIFPVCPDGGAYALNAVGEIPGCSVPGHVLAQ